jgi:hypothetical protein
MKIKESVWLRYLFKYWFRVGDKRNVTFQDSKNKWLLLLMHPGINRWLRRCNWKCKNSNNAPNSLLAYMSTYGANGNHWWCLQIDGIVNEKDKYRFHKPVADVYGLNTSATSKLWYGNAMERFMGYLNHKWF